MGFTSLDIINIERAKINIGLGLGLILTLTLTLTQIGTALLPPMSLLSCHT